MCKGELLYCGENHFSEKMVATAPRPSGNPLDEYPGRESGYSRSNIASNYGESGFDFKGLFGKGDTASLADDQVGKMPDEIKPQQGGGGKLLTKGNLEGGIAVAGMVGQGIKALSTEQGKICRSQCKSAGGLFSKARKQCKQKCKAGEDMRAKIAPVEEKKTPWGLIIGGVVALLLIVVVLVVVMKRKTATT